MNLMKIKLKEVNKKLYTDFKNMNNFLLSIYNKIIEQSKKNFFFNDFLIPDEFNFRLEIFQLNLILILWYMKNSNLKKKYRVNYQFFY